MEAFCWILRISVNRTVLWDLPKPRTRILTIGTGQMVLSKKIFRNNCIKNSTFKLILVTLWGFGFMHLTTQMWPGFLQNWIVAVVHKDQMRIIFTPLLGEAMPTSCHWGEAIGIFLERGVTIRQICQHITFVKELFNPKTRINDAIYWIIHSLSV